MLSNILFLLAVGTALYCRYKLHKIKKTNPELVRKSGLFDDDVMTKGNPKLKGIAAVYWYIKYNLIGVGK